MSLLCFYHYHQSYLQTPKKCSLNSIYKFGLSVNLFVSNKCPNGWTDRVQIFCGTLRDPREGSWMIKTSKICLQQNSIFNKFETFWKSTKFFLWHFRNFFGFVLHFSQREHVHNWNRKWAQPSSYINIYTYIYVDLCCQHFNFFLNFVKGVIEYRKSVKKIQKFKYLKFR